MKTKARKKAAPKMVEPEMLIHASRESCSLLVWKHGTEKFVWRVQQSFDNFTSDDPQEGDLDVQGEAKTLWSATQAAFDALADHLDIE